MFRELIDLSKLKWSLCLILQIINWYLLSFHLFCNLLICVRRVWGVRCSSLGSYGTWREMFIFRSRVHTAGCYISKTTYIRPGENSFQDRAYRPWHLVHYFRYFRWIVTKYRMMSMLENVLTLCCILFIMFLYLFLDSVLFYFLTVFFL